nr:hypothetical protein [Micromonospora sp. DSM 115978]
MRSGRARSTPPVHRPGPHTAAALPSLLLLILVLTSLACADPGAGPESVPGSAAGADRTPADTKPAGPLDRALLPAGDLGPGWRKIREPAGQPAWPWTQEDCPGYRAADYPAQGHRKAAVQRGYLGEGVQALHVVEAYQPGWAIRAMADARQAVSTCPHYPFLGGEVSFTVRDVDPVGDEILVVQGRIERATSPATVSYFIAVRRGDTVSTLNLPDPGDEREVHALAGRLAALLGMS